MLEREWVRAVGHRDVPGRPALYATTRQFLDYFNLKSLNDLPTLAEIRDIDSINAELDLAPPDDGVFAAQEQGEDVFISAALDVLEEESVHAPQAGEDQADFSESDREIRAVSSGTQ